MKDTPAGGRECDGAPTGTLVFVSTVEAVASVLRSLADARDGPFYALWIDLTRSSAQQQPTIDFRIYHAVGPDEGNTHTVVGVSGVREDGRTVSWALVLDAGSELRIIGVVEVDEENGGSRALYAREKRVDDAGAAARAIATLAADVCAQREWWTASSI